MRSSSTASLPSCKSRRFMQWLLYHTEAGLPLTDIAEKVKNASQDFEAKIKTEGDHLEGKPSSETLNKAKIKARDALT